MNAGAIWVVAGLVLAALEMVHPGVFLLPIGGGAVAAGLLTAALGFGWHGQIAAFVGCTLLLVALLAKRLLRARRPDLVNDPARSLVGQSCRAISFRDGEGRVSLGNGTWAARVQGGIDPETGQALTITGLDGTTLLVAAKA